MKRDAIAALVDVAAIMRTYGGALSWHRQAVLNAIHELESQETELWAQFPLGGSTTIRLFVRGPMFAPEIKRLEENLALIERVIARDEPTPKAAAIEPHVGVTTE